MRSGTYLLGTDILSRSKQGSQVSLVGRSFFLSHRVDFFLQVAGWNGYDEDQERGERYDMIQGFASPHVDIDIK